MTLNIMAVSPSKVYLTGDFRLTYLSTSAATWKDDLDTQKLIPVVKLDWSALVSFTGIARTADGIDVGDWIAEQLNQINVKDSKEKLWTSLLPANKWLAKIPNHNRLTICAVGFNRRKPFAGMLSNFQNIKGGLLPTIKNDISLSEIKIKKPTVLILGDTTSVDKREIDELKTLISQNRPTKFIHNYLGELSSKASSRSSTISAECVTGHIIQSGSGEIIPHGIPDNKYYFPGFVKKHFRMTKVCGFEKKLDENGNPLPLKWVGLTFAKAQDKLSPTLMAILFAIRNALRPITTEQEIIDDDKVWKL